MRALLAALALVCGTQAVAALELTFPAAARQTASNQREFVSYKLPIGPSKDGETPTLIADGRMVEAAWRAEIGQTTTVALMDDLRQQLEKLGFELLFECATHECGGFDFRFDIPVLPEPAMHVDLGEFRYLAAQRLGQAVPEYVSLLISRSAEFAYVQIVNLGGPNVDGLTLKAGDRIEQIQVAVPTQSFGSVAEALERSGSAVLDDLIFETGSSSLGQGKFLSLADLARYLQENPTSTVALVGHTDAQGSLEGNIALSRRRAGSVAKRLIDEFEVDPSQVSSDGVGYLAPRASNQTAKGRAENRRVEVILTSTQ